MKCERFENAIHEYYRGTLGGAERAEVERHAADCPACSALKKACEELSCRELVELLAQFVGGELPPARKQVLERHLRICRDCEAYLASYRATLALTASAFDDEPEPLPESLVRAILAKRPE
jgi:anti-sigma factor RsiW